MRSTPDLVCMQVSWRSWLFAACCLIACPCLEAHAAPVTADSNVAASFDCTHAVGTDTDIICSDPILRRADTDLSRLYRAVLADADGQAHIDALKNDERSWLLRRNSECGVSKSLKLNSNQLPGYVDCFLAAYDDRVDDLHRMQADPKADPSSISAPIRKSTFGDAVTDIALPAGVLIDTGLLTSDTGRPVLGFASDSRLLVLGAKAEQSDIALYSFKAGVLEAPFNAPSAIPPTASLCIASKSIVVLPARGGQTALVAAQNKLQPEAVAFLASDVQRGCGISSDRTLVSNADGTFALDLGPRLPSPASSVRYVALVDAQGEHELAPPIRIDRRFQLMAQFSPSQGKFVVSEATASQDVRTIADRNWAKTSCGAFWLVDPATKHSTRACIPFGSYVEETNDAVIVPLPTGSGLYFAIANRGLFKVVDGAAKRVVAAPISQPHVAADGCSIAFLGSPGKAPPQRHVMLVNACAVP